MLLQTLLIFLILGVCKGFDFTFDKSTSVTLDDACGLLKCTETITDDDNDTRKIKSLTIYRHKAVDVSGLSQWEQLASLTPQSPTDKRVSDAKHIDGTFAEKLAHIQVKLHKNNDCKSPQFACISRLVNDLGQTSVIKSVIGGNGESGDIFTIEPAYVGPYSTSNKIETLLTAMVDKLNCFENRFGDASKRDERFEDKLEALNEKMYRLERTISRDVDASGDRIEDKMELMKDRLEDKLSELKERKSLYTVETTGLTKVCANLSHQLSLIGNAVDLLDKNMNSLSDRVRNVQDTVPSLDVLNAKLDTMVSTFSDVAAVTNNFTTEVGALSHSCVEKSPESVPEFFDVLSSGKREWRLAFRGTAHINVDIYTAYLYGTGIPSKVEVGCKQYNRSMPCSNHYRNNDAFENWTNVDEVLLALYVKGQVVKHITFNGRGSSYIDWFEGNRVIGSSWTDLKTSGHNFFSIKGDDRPHLLRQFFVNNAYPSGGCPTDRGWFVAASALPGECAWEKKLAHPVFIYSKTDTAVSWGDPHNVGRADAMGVFVKYQ